MGLGTILGTALAPVTGGLSAPIGMGLDALKGSGTLLGLLKGGSQNRQARKSEQAAESLQPPLYDPQQQAFLAEINQKRKSIGTGSAYASGMGAIDAGTAGVNQAGGQAAGGDTGGTIQALLAAQNQGNRAKNQVLSQAGQEGQFYNTFAGNLTKSMADRAMQLQLAQQAQKRAVWAQKSQDAFGNIGNAVARMGGAGDSGGGIDWGDLLNRHGASMAPAEMSPEQQALNLSPEQSGISPVEAVDPGLPPFDFSKIGIGNTGGIPTF